MHVMKELYFENNQIPPDKSELRLWQIVEDQKNFWLLK
jgi:hypothetical protein